MRVSKPPSHPNAHVEQHSGVCFVSLELGLSWKYLRPRPARALGKKLIQMADWIEKRERKEDNQKKEQQ